MRQETPAKKKKEEEKSKSKSQDSELKKSLKIPLLRQKDDNSPQVKVTQPFFSIDPCTFQRYTATDEANAKSNTFVIKQTDCGQIVYVLAPCGQNRFITNHERDTTQWGFNKIKSPIPLTSDHYVHSGITDKTIIGAWCIIPLYAYIKRPWRKTF